MAAFPADCLPPENTYESRDALFKTINAWAAPRHYAFINGRSTKEKSGKLTVTYYCDRRTKPPDPLKERQRNTSSRGTGCEFSVIAKESSGGLWTLKHRHDQRFASHNHGPSPHTISHPVLRELSAVEITTLTGLTNAGIAPRNIRTYIRQTYNTTATQQDIYNKIADAKRQVLEGQSTIQAFANQLFEEGFWSQFQTDLNGQVTAVLFAHPKSLAYLQEYPDVFILDCTYKTNKYKMPLLDMIGVDACQRSFCIGFAFLNGEAEGDYAWVLSRLKSLYEQCQARLPSVILTDRCLACMNAAASLLCLWHANKAVLRYCRPAFVSHNEGTDGWGQFYGYWHSIIQSPNEAIFDQCVQEFESKYLPDYAHEVSYVKSTWLDTYKEKLVKAWVDQHAHFNHVNTSRVEGIHWLVKSHLKTSTLDLFEAWRAVKHALFNQLSDLEANQARQQVRIPIDLNGSLYSTVRGWVSHEALRKIDNQRRLLAQRSPSLSRCSGSFTQSNGLPCMHTLQTLMETHQPLTLEHFHSHWHLQRNGTPQLLLEPRQRFDRATAHSGLPRSSTRREPSGFEAVDEDAQRSTALRKDGHYHKSSDARPTPPAPLELSLATIIANDIAKAAANEAAVEAAAQAAQAAYTFTPTSAEALAIGSDETPAIAGVCAAANITSHATADAADSIAADAGASADCIIVELLSSPSPILTSPIPPPSLRSYDDPRAIFERYVNAREDWYKSQPRGSIKTNQEYRKAMRLPVRYSEASYAWCRDFKRMGRHHF